MLPSGKFYFTVSFVDVKNEPFFPRSKIASYSQVNSPNSKCEDFLAKVNERLSLKIRGELDNEVKQQALFCLLGEDFVRLQFPHHKYCPEMLDPPKTKPEVTKE